MAVQSVFTVTATQYGYAKVASSAALTNGNTTNPFRAGQYPWSAFTVTGTLGVGGSVQLETSNDGGVNWVKVGAAITALPGIIQNQAPIGELGRFNATAGDGTTAFNINGVLSSVRA